MSHSFRAFGQAVPNKGNEVFQFQGYGPAVVIAQQWDDVDYLLSFLKRDATLGRFVTPVISRVGVTAQETVRTGASGHVGNAALLTFTCVVGAAGDLGNTFACPLVPGSLSVYSMAAVPVAPTLYDYNADGILYSAAGVACGTVNYEYGYMSLSYPALLPPGVGNINVAFHSTTWRTTYGNTLLTLDGQLRDEPVKVVALSKGSIGKSCRVAVEANVAW